MWIAVIRYEHLECQTLWSDLKQDKSSKDQIVGDKRENRIHGCCPQKPYIWKRLIYMNQKCFLLSGDAHARRPLHKMDSVFFFSFCRSLVGTSGLAPSPTSGPLILPVFGKIWEIAFTYFANFECSRRFSRLHLVDLGKEVLRFLHNSVSIAVFSAEAN